MSDVITTLRMAVPLAVLFVTGCSGHDQAATASATPGPSPSASEKPKGAPSASATPTSPSAAASGDASAPKVPPDGKYERVTVEGVTVPMIEVMDGGNVVLVDIDGKKPRTWEEQYKRKDKGKVPLGSFDVHKTDANKNGKFDDDPIDKEGLWVIDDKGNITKH